jgi:hypothetical protein
MLGHFQLLFAKLVSGQFFPKVHQYQLENTGSVKKYITLIMQLFARIINHS